jgi:HAD superfamily hydrolase (TIGR01459 family)
MSYWDALPERYRVILCDIWGVVHDGVQLYPNAAERLAEWREARRKVILITNAPRTAEAVAEQLGRIGLPSGSWDGIATSGEAGIAALLSVDRPVGFVGTDADRAILEQRGVKIASDQWFTHVACSGIEERRPYVEQYFADLQLWSEAGVTLHCLNPDRLVIRGGVPEPCAGAIADVYEELGGQVCWYGKPFPAIYEHALYLAGDPDPNDVLAVGDSLQTDILGAARMGFDAVFVAGGIHGGAPFPQDFGKEHGLVGWQPVAVVDGLA